MRRAATTLLLLTGLALVHAPATAQADADFEADVRELMGFTELDGIAEQIASGLVQQVLVLSGALPEERLAVLRESTAEEFTVQAMREDVIATLVEAGDPATVADLLEWLPSGATAELDRVREAYEPQLTLEEYASELEANLPPQARIVTIAGWAQTQQAPLFYLAVEEALQEAAHTIANALGDDAPPYEPPAASAVRQALEAYLSLAVVTFLWSLEPAPDDLIQRAAAEYSSPSGQWFVEEYSVAVTEAIDRAAERVAARVAG